MVGINTKLGCWFTFGKKVPKLQLSTSLFAQQETNDEPAEESGIDAASDPINEKTSRDIEFLFRSELLGIEPPKDDEQEKALEKQKHEEVFKKIIRRSPSGRYSYLLPFNEKLPELGSNEKLAKIRLENLISKSSKGLLAAADTEVEKYVRDGYAERAPVRKPGEFAHYLPIQIVKKVDPDSPSG